MDRFREEELGDVLEVYSKGRMDEEEIEELFQWLLDTGYYWELGNDYQLLIMDYLECGIIHR